MADTNIDEVDLDEEPLPLPKMSCKHTECAKNLHCFQQDKQRSKPVVGGKCRECGAELVTWSRVHARNFQDSSFTFSMLRLEWIRHAYFHRRLSQRKRNYALRKGRVGVRMAAEKRIRGRVASMNPRNDLTPWNGDILDYAQHATASCCRTCIAEWHGIPGGRELNENEINYFTDLICLYVAERVPELTENGENIPPIRKAKLPGKG